MSAEEFYAWQLDQEDRYELVDGVPVLHRMMSGASNFHDTVVVNCIVALQVQLRGGPRRVASADTAVRTAIRRSRRPDLTVDCAPPEPGSYEAHRPTLVLEVLSPSNRGLDWVRKQEEYKRLPSVAYVIYAAADSAEAVLLTRTDEGWADEPFSGLDAVIGLPAIGARLALADMYDGIPLTGEPAG